MRKKSKQNAIEPETLRSPTPSIALSAASGHSKNLDDVSIQEQLSLFYYGNQTGKDASGRRYSHPNQLKFVEEYENQRRASTTSTSPLPPMMGRSGSTAGIGSSYNLAVAKTDSPPPSPVMMFPVIPPGIKITNTDDDHDHDDDKKIK